MKPYTLSVPGNSGTQPLLCQLCFNESLLYNHTNVYLRHATMGNASYIEFFGIPSCKVHAVKTYVPGNLSLCRSGLAVQLTCTAGGCDPHVLPELIITDDDGGSRIGWRPSTLFIDPARSNGSS